MADAPVLFPVLFPLQVDQDHCVWRLLLTSLSALPASEARPAWEALVEGGTSVVSRCQSGI